MTKLILAAGLILVALGAISTAQAASIPCEEMLKQLRVGTVDDEAERRRPGEDQ